MADAKTDTVSNLNLVDIMFGFVLLTYLIIKIIFFLANIQLTPYCSKIRKFKENTMSRMDRHVHFKLSFIFHLDMSKLTGGRIFQIVCGILRAIFYNKKKKKNISMLCRYFGLVNFL